MVVPFWAVLAFAAALSATAIPLIQEKFRADGFALALWNKVMDCILFLPFVLYFGAPNHWQFYFYTALTALIYSVCDVVYFRAIPVIGSGMMTRLLPSSVVITFLLWFIIDPQQIDLYLAQPLKATAIAAILSLFVVCGYFVKRCQLSWAGMRLVWPVIAAASIGPLFSKLALDHAGAGKVTAPINYLFFQALMMIVCYSLYYKIKRPISREVLFAKESIRTAIVLGIVMAGILVLKMKALQLVDNPGYVSMIFFTDALWVLLVYKLIGKRETANIWAGLGIVFCAALLVLVKSL